MVGAGHAAAWHRLRRLAKWKTRQSSRAEGMATEFLIRLLVHFAPSVADTLDLDAAHVLATVRAQIARPLRTHCTTPHAGEQFALDLQLLGLSRMSRSRHERGGNQKGKHNAIHYA